MACFTLSIERSEVLLNAFRMKAGKVLRILLDGGAQQAPVRFDGSFSIYEVAEGVHLLDVDAPGFLFDQVLPPATALFT